MKHKKILWLFVICLSLWMLPGRVFAAPDCTCGTDEPTIHATNCPAYAAPENPECSCAEKCTEDNVNVWCDICGVQGADACLADSAVSQTTYAGGTIWVGGVALTDSAPYLAVGAGTAQANQPQSGGYAHWDAATNTLTLNNYTYSGKGYAYVEKGVGGIYASAAIYAERATKDFKINLVGENSLSNTSSSTNMSEQGYSYGIAAYYSVSINGEGSLAVSANTGIAIESSTGELSITGGTITLSPNPNDTSDLCYGIFAYLSDITIGGDANVSITQGSSSTKNVAGIYFWGDSSNKNPLSITGNATLTISGSEATAGKATGIDLNHCQLTINENAKVSIASKASSGNSSYGIYAANGSTLTVNGNAQLTAKAGNGSATEGDGSYGIYNAGTGNITIGGTAKVTAESAEGGGSQAIHTEGALTVSGTPTVTATSGTSTGKGRDNGGIYAIENISLEGGKVVAIGGSSQSNSFGIYTAEQLILGTATVNATGGSAAEGKSISVEAVKGISVQPEGKSISVLTGENESADTLVEGAPFSTNKTLYRGDTDEKQFLSYPGTHTHTWKWSYEDSTGHWQECSDENCPDTYKGKTATSPHNFDNDSDALCDTCGYTRTIDGGGGETGGGNTGGGDGGNGNTGGNTGGGDSGNDNTGGNTGGGDSVAGTTGTTNTGTTTVTTTGSKTDTPASVTVPVTGGENTVHVEASVEDSAVTVTDLDQTELKTVLEGENVTGEIVIDLTGLKKEIDAVNLPADTLEAIVKASEDASAADGSTAKLVIQLSTGTVTVNDKTLRAVVEQAACNTIRLVLDDAGKSRLNSAQKEAVSELNVYGGIEAYFLCVKENKRIGDFKGGVATLEIPFEIPTDLKAEGFSVWYVDDEGNLEQLDTWYEDGHLIWDVSHFSDFIIAYADPEEVTENEEIIEEKAEEPAETEAQEPVQEETGRSLPAILIIILILAVLAGAWFFLIWKRKKDEEEEIN